MAMSYVRFIAVLLLISLIPTFAKSDFQIFELAPLFDGALDSNDSFIFNEGFENSDLIIGDNFLLPLATLENGTPLINDTFGRGFPDGLESDRITVRPLAVDVDLGWVANREDSGNNRILFGRGFEIDVVGSPLSAISFSFQDILVDDPFVIEVFDNDGNLVILDDDFSSLGDFVGIVADRGYGIGSVRITNTTVLQPVYLDNIQLFETQGIPEPQSLFVIATCVLMVTTRRRSR